MHLVDSPGSKNGLFVPGNPFLGAPSTIVDADIMNALQLEIANVILGVGIPLDKNRADQLRSAIQAMTLQGGGSLAALGDASQQAPSLYFRPEMPGPTVLVSAGHQKNDIEPGITLGETPEPPSSGATINPNGYEGGADNEQSGHHWPYQTPFGAQMQSNVAGWYPACVQDQGINYYAYPDFLTFPGMLGIGGGRVRIQIDGQIEVDGTNPDGYAVELLMIRNPNCDWNNGDGGMVNNPGTFPGNRYFTTVSPKVDNTIATAHNFQVVLDLYAVFKRALQGTAHWLIAPSTGVSAPVVDETRTVTYTAGATVTFQNKINPWKVLLKIDAFDAGGATFPTAQVCNTPFGGGGSTPPNAAQDGSECRVTILHSRADYLPSGH